MRIKRLTTSALNSKFLLISCALGSIGIWLGFPNSFIQLPFLVLLWPASLGLLAQHCSTRFQAFRLGWLGTFPGMALALYWLCYPVHDVGGLPWAAAVACAMLIAAVLASQGGLFCLLLRPFSNLGLWAAVAGGLLWYLLEAGFAMFPGFPWLPLSGALAPWPTLVQTSDLVGAYFTGALWAAISLLLLCRSPMRSKSLLCAAGSVCMLGYGWWCLQATPFSPLPQGQATMGALFVEGNVEQNQKWLPEFQNATINLYSRLTLKGVYEIAGEANPLVVWPETAMPFFYERDPVLRERIRDLAESIQTPILFGAPGVSTMPGSQVEQIYNRAFLIDPLGKTLGTYDKVHLVPFGEYVPEWLQLDFLSGLLQGVGVYSPGDAGGPLEYGPLALGMLICYEAIFPWLAQERVEAGANLLVDISNDGWFRDSPAARQHLYLGVLRCIEQNRWLLRGTNTGISAISDSRGRIVLQGDMFRAGFLFGRAELLTTHTLYFYLEPFIPFAALAAFAALVLAVVKKRRQSRDAVT